MSENLLYEDLIALQRKEKKELLARTQQMKHSVPRGDKKKKKEVTNEIAQLFADLDLKHENELKEYEAKQKEPKYEISLEPISDEVVSEKDEKQNSEITEAKSDAYSIGNSSKEPSQKISKAQKRRNKKAQMEKKRIEEIEKQEMENYFGPRHVESEAIKKKLSERNLTVHEVPSDGNCLYTAVQHQLSTLNTKEASVESLRRLTSEYLLSNKTEYLPFLTDPETGDALNEDQYVKYCEDIAKTSAWGGHIEVQALSHVCGIPIEIIQAEGPSIFAGDENIFPKLTLSYHRHVYGLGEHYNSVVPMKTAV